MLIGFVGDVHGRVFHALAALAICQAGLGRSFDLLIQVGDMGAYPDPTRTDESTQVFLALDPSEADFSRLLAADGERAERLRGLRQQFAASLHFIRGNHEDFGWLYGLPVDAQAHTAAVDPFDLLRFVPDGTVLEVGGLRLGFLGGAELPGEAAIDRDAYQSLMDLGLGAVDLLVTHEPPYGTGVGYHGNVQGSRLVTRLVEQIQPTFHVAGHLHEVDGPRDYGRTTYLRLSSLVASVRWQPDARGMQPGCLGVLDTETGDLRHVMDDWLAGFPTPFDFDAWASTFLAAEGA